MTAEWSFLCVTCTEEFSAKLLHLRPTFVPPCPCCGSEEVVRLGEGASERRPDQAHAA